MTKRIALLFAALVLAPAFAEDFTADGLLGKWEFTAYAEIDSPDDRTAVGVVFDFRPDGVLISKMSTGDVEAAYTVMGTTINYSDARGKQTWTVRTFEPDESIVIENSGTLMFLERR